MIFIIIMIISIFLELQVLKYVYKYMKIVHVSLIILSNNIFYIFIAPKCID